MPSICHSGPPHHDHHHLSLRFTPLCPPPTTQAHPTVDTQHLSLRPNPSPPPVTQAHVTVDTSICHSGPTHHRHLSFRLTPSPPPPVTQAHSTMPSTLQFCYQYTCIPAFGETDWPAITAT